MKTASMAMAIVSGVCLSLLAVACGGGGGPTIDIRDFDTARFAMSQTTTTDGNVVQSAGEGVIDNRQQALSLTFSGGLSGRTIAIGRTVYSYNEAEQRWVAVTEPSDGQVGFGRPYWPQFWRDAVQIENLGGQTLEGVETTHYLLTFDRERLTKRLRPAGYTGALDVREAEVEVWVDNGSRYPVQLTFRLDLTYGAASTRLEITSTFFDFGAEVELEAPEGATPAEGGP